LSYIGNTNLETWETPRTEFFSGNGTTTNFKLTRKIYSVGDVQIFVNNVIQSPIESYNYNYTNNSIDFFDPPASGFENISVRFHSRSNLLISPSQGTITPDSLSVGHPSWDTKGNVTVYGTLNIEGQLTWLNNLSANNDITAGNGVIASYFNGNGAQIINLSANNITTGTVATARLGSGTADSTKYLSGDSSWKPVVTAFSAGTTGLSPSSSSSGAIILGGVLNTSTGGTGLTSFVSGGAVYATNTNTLATGTLPIASGGTGSTNFTANTVLIGNGSSALREIAPGGVNNILLSNGTTWVSANALASGIGVGVTGGRGIKFTSSGTFTVPTGVTQIKVTVVGAGGGYVMSPDFKYGSKGGDGGTAVVYLPVSFGQTIPVTVGLKGSTLSAFVGYAGTGGTSSFGTYCTATGGLGGYFDYWSIAQDGGSGLGTVGDFNMSGYRYNLIASKKYYGQGAEFNVTVPDGLVLIEY
jgi:hypothetical protein